MAQILITGGSSGIGLEMARHCLRRGHEVAITGRDVLKTEGAAEALRESVPGAEVRALTLDLGDFSAVDAFAAAVVEAMPALSRVILNAGSFTPKLRTLENGLEAMIGTMHFGHFRLMQHLLPSIQQQPGARVVVTSSVAHWLGRINEQRFFNASSHFSAATAYGQAKLANLLYARTLARRLRDTDVLVNAFHPGAVATGIWRELPSFARAFVGRTLISPARGADTGSWLILGDDDKQQRGGYFVRRKVAFSSPASRDDALGDWLWERSEAIAGVVPPSSGTTRMQA
ncbi:SDR family NAD(P)-dependent oxidoreductase [Algiphilus sp. NNCM1]|nr:SDR family NAD(P)-dependent oxidoreductase [Algiphilus acroporae]MCI5062963.1 SDR family NAD(P)-dependent oxidoreductase [Algiphilus sp.]